MIGDAFKIGGAVAAPFTLGLSLIATAVGGVVCAAGGVTSAGASITELCITKRKISTIQKMVEEDDARLKEIQGVWERIQRACCKVTEKHSVKGYTLEDVVSVLLVCCIDFIPDRVLNKFSTPRNLKATVYSNSKLKEFQSRCTETGNHAVDVAFDIGSGIKSSVDVVKACGGVVLTAFVVKFADKGCTAAFHCSKMGLPQKIVSAAKFFRVATGTNPVFAVIFSSVFSIVDLGSLIYGAYQIHKKSDSSAGKQLIRIRDKLQEGRNQLEKLKDCLSDVM